MSDFEKTLYLTFSDQQSAADALNAMQYAYRSRLYEWHAHGQCTPSEFIVIFPEGAKSLLSEELQHQAKECIYPTQGAYFHPVVYRFIEDCYINDFLTTGTLQISTFKHCRQLEDTTRQDTKEGQSMIIGEYGGMHMETQMMMGDDVFLLCTSLASKYRDADGIVNETALEIYDLGGFVDACTKAIIDKGYHVLNVLIGPCFYSAKQIYGDLLEGETSKMQKGGDLTLEDIFAIPQRIAGPKMFFQKPLEKAIESEYRMVWVVYPEPKDDTILIQIENPTKYARKVTGV